MLVGVVEDWVRGVRSQLLQWSARLLGQEQWQPYSSAQVRAQPSSLLYSFTIAHVLPANALHCCTSFDAVCVLVAESLQLVSSGALQSTRL